MISTDPWVWLSALLTLCSYSLLYGDNKFFRFGEYVYVSTTIAHSVCTGITTIQGRFAPLWTGAQPSLIITFVLGLMSIFVVWRKYAWIASIPIAILMGVGIALSTRTMVATDIIGNMQSVISDAANVLSTAPPADRLGYLVRIICTIAGLFYFIFTMFHKGTLSKPVSYLSELGKYVLLTYLALQVGNDIMQFQGNVTASIVRLFSTWLGIG